MTTLKIEKITKMNEEQQKALLRLLSRASINLKLEIVGLHRANLYKFKNTYKDYEINLLSYCALILATQKIVDEYQDLKNKNFKNLDNNEIKKLSSKKAHLFIDKQYRTQLIRDKLLNYWSIIKQLKEKEKFSFRQIAKYLKKNHKLTVAHSTIYNLWNELETNKKEK